MCLPHEGVLRNRFAKAVMGEALGIYDNPPTLELARLYRLWPASGLGWIVMGNV